MRRLLTPIAMLLVPAALVLGIYLGGHPSRLPGFVRSALVQDSQGRVFDEAIDRITADYYRKVDRDRLLNASLAAAVASLGDRFSHYFDPHAFTAFEQSTTGEFEGVGMTVQQDPLGLKVLTVFPGSPADKAGLRSGDVIVSVDGRSLKGRPSGESTSLIKGPKGTTVRLGLMRDGRRLEATARREEVSVPVTRSRMITARGEKIAYVELAQFTSGSHGEVASALRRLLDKGAKGVVFDLRDNGGGLLEEGVLTASLFIPDGTIVTTRGRNRPSRTFTASGEAVAPKVPVAVLVNNQTASASEIVTGALQDRHRATVVGTRTYGKGVFQEIQNLSNGGALDITVGEYFTPSGRNLGPRDGRPGGITPDVRAVDNPHTKPDEALRRAAAVVAEKIR